MNKRLTSKRGRGENHRTLCIRALFSLVVALQACDNSSASALSTGCFANNGRVGFLALIVCFLPGTNLFLNKRTLCTLKFNTNVPYSSGTDSNSENPTHEKNIYCCGKKRPKGRFLTPKHSGLGKQLCGLLISSRRSSFWFTCLTEQLLMFLSAFKYFYNPTEVGYGKPPKVNIYGCVELRRAVLSTFRRRGARGENTYKSVPCDGTSGVLC